MRVKLLSIGLALGLTSLFSQGPMYDTVTVNLPHPVTIKGTVLQPGEYVIKQMQSASNTRVLHIFRDGGMRLETTVMTIPALDNKTPESTKVILQSAAGSYYFDKIWIQGKDYGYEFPLPDDVKSRMKESGSMTVAARYQPEATKVTETTVTETTTQTPEVTTQAQVDTAQADKDRLAAEERERQSQAERERQAQADRDRAAQEERDRLAQQQASADRDRAAQEERDRLERERQAQADRDRLAQQQQQTAANTQELPSTSANWLTTLMAGAALLGAGLKLRRS